VSHRSSVSAHRLAAEDTPALRSTPAVARLAWGIPELDTPVGIPVLDTLVGIPVGRLAGIPVPDTLAVAGTLGYPAEAAPVGTRAVAPGTAGLLVPRRHPVRGTTQKKTQG